MKKIAKIFLVFTLLLSVFCLPTEKVSADFCDLDEQDPLPLWCEE